MFYSYSTQLSISVLYNQKVDTEMNDIIKEYVEERLYEIQDATGLNFILCNQSFGGTLYACLSQYIREDIYLDSR